MEVHPPDHPIHTKKDFFLHLFTITIGLLIALTLEGLVEYMHHRHIVAEARENIRREIQDDHKAAQEDLKLLKENIDRESANIETIHLLSKHPKDFKGGVQNHMDFDSMDQSAWRTARDTGALAYMPYDEVQRYSDMYMLVDLVNNSSVETAKADFEAAVPFELGTDPAKLPDAEYDKLLHGNAAVRVQLSVLSQIVQQLDDVLVKELKR